MLFECIFTVYIYCIVVETLMHLSALMQKVKGHTLTLTFSDPGAGELVSGDITLLEAVPRHKPEPTGWKLE